ncbi:predicted protein [Streptomyces viridosporus ATCC 14672]|uniref:Predicted protein n=1 Tax=Streptomyces viridosporus (strain ATCC 14672 / DSM 40746 / JCM 4963 / KCTC 9882 / NRRL B-12104 / FH 1290) TaxID=566461 RepID=D5ZTY5_STRV1|nr:predicted protein [Streptomyces viridosporus ATCC 14672]
MSRTYGGNERRFPHGPWTGTLPHGQDTDNVERLPEGSQDMRLGRRQVRPVPHTRPTGPGTPRIRRTGRTPVECPARHGAAYLRVCSENAVYLAMAVLLVRRLTRPVR